MNKTKKSIAVLALGGLLVGLMGCQKDEGPLERAGKSVDNAAAKTGEAVKDAGNNVKDTVKGDNK